MQVVADCRGVRIPLAEGRSFRLAGSRCLCKKVLAQQRRLRKLGVHGNRRLRKAGGARGKQELSAFGEQVLANAGSCGQQRRA